MFYTFFCKRDRHNDCPGRWPINEECGLEEDCSFDLKMIKCDCGCHKENENP